MADYEPRADLIEAMKKCLAWMEVKQQKVVHLLLSDQQCQMILEFLEKEEQ